MLDSSASQAYGEPDCLLDFARLLHQTDKGPRLMAFLDFYVDESGHSSTHPVVVVAGFLGSADAWVGFRDNWNAILAEHGVTPPFHMTDFEAKIGQFQGWDEHTQRRPLLKSLVDEIVCRPLYLLGAAVSVEVFKRVEWDDRMEPLEDPYHSVLQDVLQLAVTVSDDPDCPDVNGERIAVVIAKQREFGAVDGGTASLYYEALAQWPANGKLVKAAVFGDQEEFPQLQAADIAAFELRWPYVSAGRRRTGLRSGLPRKRVWQPSTSVSWSAGRTFPS